MKNIDLGVNILNTEWETPLAVGAGPLTRNAEMIAEASRQYGVGAVFTKTIYYNSSDTPKPTMANFDGGLINFDWSGKSIEEWVKDLKKLGPVSFPLIANIYEEDKDKLIEMGKRLKNIGLECFEIPIKANLSPSETQENIGRLMEETEIPVIGKIGSNLPELEAYCKKLEEINIAALSGVNTIGPALVLDKEGKAHLGNSYGEGYVSGKALKPLSLRTTYYVTELVDLPYIAAGGINSYLDVLDYLRAGASAVYLVSGAILNGFGTFEKIKKDLKEYMERHNYESISQIKGSARKHINQEPVWDKKIPEIDLKACKSCGKCVTACIYDSLIMEEGDPRHKETGDNCFGCGLCVTVCPFDAIYFSD